MAVSEQAFKAAELRTIQARQAGHAVAAEYDAPQKRLVVSLNNGVVVMVPVAMLEGLASATADELAEIAISPSGLGLSWPKLDADLRVPELLLGIFGTKRWMASQLGVAGGKARSPGKADAARENGRKGGRPRKQA